MWQRAHKILIFIGIAKLTSKELVAVHVPVPMPGSSSFPTSEPFGILIQKNDIPNGVLICNSLLMSEIEHREQGTPCPWELSPGECAWLSESVTFPQNFFIVAVVSEPPT